ncbi:MAG: hypothetical protein OWU33_12040 [Firmicutes bacterium]|nr:hypothetical protein [Bacillota bacterium]
MKVIVEFVDAHGQPVPQPSPEQLEALANHFAKALLKVRFPEIALKDAPAAAASQSLRE